MTDDLLLAIETSQLQGSVALARGPHLLAARELSADRRHAAELMPTIDQILRAAGRHVRDVSVFAYSCGPGSFTGLRVAATIGRMLQSATTCRVVAVPTLEVIAQHALTLAEPPNRLGVMVDARRGQIFGGIFERRNSEWETFVPAGLFEPAGWLASIEKPFHVTGDGLKQHAEAVAAAGGSALTPEFWPARAEHLATVGWRLALAGRFCQPEEIVPHYIRRPECEEVYEQRRAEARQRRGE